MKNNEFLSPSNHLANTENTYSSLIRAISRLHFNFIFCETRIKIQSSSFDRRNHFTIILDSTAEPTRWIRSRIAASKSPRNRAAQVSPSPLPRLVALFRLYFTNRAIIMTFKRRCADCTATGITFPNRLIYLAPSWANNNQQTGFVSWRITRAWWI